MTHLDAEPEPALSENARTVLEARYLRRDHQGSLIETPAEMFFRVARAVAAAEERFADAHERSSWQEKFLDALTRLDFLPNSPTLMNAGTRLGQLSACFVLPVEDSMDRIFDSLKLMALVQQSGGGTGFSFSRLRPQGDVVASTGGEASGPVSFMRVFDAATENIRQGGKRRGANMAVLSVDHPDVFEFVDAKRDADTLRNFNLSVAASDAFMEAARDRRPFALRHPRTREPVQNVAAAELLWRISDAAWHTGDPGLMFVDAVNRANPTPKLGPIEATNPCGEVPLLPCEACNLGSINLAHMVRGTGSGAEIAWDALAAITRLAVRFLDDVVEVSRWPSPEIEAMARANRKVGLGVMGFAEMLIQLGVSYASPQAVALAEELMSFINAEALAASRELAEQRGVFPEWRNSTYGVRGIRVRNATRTSIAPTGTISIIAGTSASIEPLFALAYHRKGVLQGEPLPELNPLFLRYARERGFYDERLVEQLKEGRPLGEIDDVPDGAKRVFQTALEIDPLDHLRIQAAFQKHVDNAVSKTVNLPEASGVDDVLTVYETAWQCGLKGVTIFRYGSKGEQVLHLGAEETPEDHEHFAKCDPGECRL
jgi:ribonucleoside-diphosphate reductase alpha chain